MSIYYVQNLAEQFFYFLIWYGIRTKQFALLLQHDLNEPIEEDHRETILIMCIFFHLPKYNETVSLDYSGTRLSSLDVKLSKCTLIFF